MKALIVGQRYMFKGCPWKLWNNREFVVESQRSNRQEENRRYTILRLYDECTGGIDMETHGRYIYPLKSESASFFRKE